jgi:methyl-accepting chemotaxis protein
MARSRARPSIWSFVRIDQTCLGRSGGFALAADVQKFLDGAEKTDFAHEAGALETKVLLLRVANWRMLASRDPKGLVTFKTNFEKAQQEIVTLEKAGLPSNLAAQLASLKASVIKYAEAFEKTGPNLVLGDELYYKSVTPVIVSTIAKMDNVKETIGEAFHKTTADTEDRIASTITMQEFVAGTAVLVGLLIAFLIARGIIGPLSGLTAGMKELAGGNFGVVLPGLDRKDEVGDMAQAVETFKVKAEEKAREVAEAKIKQDQVAAQQRKKDMIKLADDFESAVGEIFGLDRTRSLRQHLDGDRGTRPGTHLHGCRRVGRSLHQCAVGGLGDRRNDLVRQRDQPPGAGFGQDGQ